MEPNGIQSVMLGWAFSWGGIIVLLRHMAERLSRCDTFESTIRTALEDAVALLGAEYGNVQLLAGDTLVIVAQRGLSPEFLKAFRYVTAADGSACGRALLLGEPVIIPDTDKDLQFAIYRNIAQQMQFRAVQSSPLICPDGRRIGILSTHFANPHQLSKIETDTLHAYAVTASQHACELLRDTPLDQIATEMNKTLYDDLGIN
jgi:GAF domain-containing protein